MTIIQREIVIWQCRKLVTHNLAQAKRISDYTAFILDGELIEYNETEKIFSNPKDDRTKEYIEGIYG